MKFEMTQAQFLDDPALCTPEAIKALLKAVHQHHHNGNIRCMNDGLLIKRFVIKVKKHKRQSDLEEVIKFSELIDFLDPTEMPEASFEVIAKIAMAQGKSLPERQTENLVLFWIAEQEPNIVHHYKPPITLWTEAVKMAWISKFPFYIGFVKEPEERHFLKALALVRNRENNSGQYDGLRQIHKILETLLNHAAFYRKEDPEILQRIKFCAHRRAWELINEQMALCEKSHLRGEKDED